MLEVSNLRVSYGGIQAVKGIDLEVRERELVCLPMARARPPP